MDPNYTHPFFTPNYTPFWTLNFPETIQPNSAWSSLLNVRSTNPHYEKKIKLRKQNGFSEKRGKSCQERTSIIQSIIQ